MVRAAAGVGDNMQSLGSTAMNLVWWFSDLADLETESGDPAAAAAAMTQAERVLQDEVLPSMSGFQASTLTSRLDISRAFGLLARGEFPQALELVRVIRTDLDALEPPSPGAEQLLRWGRAWNAATGTIAAYEIGDFAASESYARSAVADWQWQPPAGLPHELLGAQFKTQLAQAIARQGRYAEAREILRPLLAYLRAQHAQPHENLMIDFRLAHALYAASRAEPGERDAHLDEASAILDRLPPSMSRWNTGQRLRNWISQARSGTG
jgi:hypothetical protein